MPTSRRSEPGAADSPPLAEAALVALCLDGDDAAWDELIARYQGLIYSVPRRMGLSDPDAADVFQNVCVILYRRLGSIREPARLGGWLLTTAARESWLVARSKPLTIPLEDESEDGAASAPLAVVPLAEDALEAIERAQILRSSLLDLSERCRTILEYALREEHDVSYDEMSRRLGIPRGSLGPTRGRCFARMRELLRARGLDG